MSRIEAKGGLEVEFADFLIRHFSPFHRWDFPNAMALMFSQTNSIKRAVDRINTIESPKYARILSRVLQKIHHKEERPFSAEEEEKLQDVLGLDSSDVTLVLETTSFFVEQAAYHLAKPSVLSQQLKNIGLNEEKVSLFEKSWSSQAKDVVDRLRKRTLVPNQLEDVNWRLNLQLAQAGRTKMKSPNAMFEMVVSAPDNKKDRIQMEFSHDELYQFYNQLETIQSQLDSLT